MNCIKQSILRHIRLRASAGTRAFGAEDGSVMEQLTRLMCTTTTHSPDQIVDRVVRLVKKFDKIDASKVTETADFQKDLSLDSLDKVELVMALEQEFSIEIPEEEADKLACCADIARFIASGSVKAAESS
ncbi:acyl carrier protein 3, mitochondrial-like [Eucalyptus grandis]|uniref:acyl carrier protein 3, mitochondrial-like n=1 Tax=Eucalyptus grandis TaxID=71139 RepID=UPI00192F003A|nr:acyl carrier protein 3, mitochondrial-like [Eucalyptus grandis]XP_039168379.1 acyl carrier protein 3, mitochondrial-like [Eucalyptus grandis]XP_039168380.1 acyl carrier protein 3, mitochondrial-like [Eucalyptus grandis]XP_039168381.1 acyl carrier protein 3, mitochondrial-like [Eucalyptus grandis]